MRSKRSSPTLAAVERATVSAMAPHQAQLRELRARSGQIATERRRRERAAHIAARAAVREQARSGEMPSVVDALAGVDLLPDERPLAEVAAFLKSGGEVRFGYSTRPGPVPFTDGRQSRSARTWGEARQAVRRRVGAGITRRAGGSRAPRGHARRARRRRRRGGGASGGMNAQSRGDRPMVVPARVSAGDTVAVVSPAAGAVGAHPHRAERAQRYLEGLGLRVRFMPNARRSDGWASASARDRADDIHAAFADPAVRVILAGIGGNHSNQLVPLLDWDLVRANPKIFQGYSDISVLHWALARNAGLRTFYGPALIPELGEWPAPLQYTAASLQAAWFGAAPSSLAPSRDWTEERIEWGGEDRDTPRARTLAASDGWHWLRGGGAAGWLFGGCLETICWHLKGSQSWLDLDGAVLFLETSEEAPSPAHVDAYLTDLEQLGVLDRAAALLVGRPAGYTPDEVAAFETVLVTRTEAAGIPVVANLDCGHTDPMLTLPFGAWTEVDGTSGRVACAEAATAG